MTNIENWIPALGISAIILAVSALMAVTVLGEIKNVLIKMYEQDQQVTEAAERILENRK